MKKEFLGLVCSLLIATTLTSNAQTKAHTAKIVYKHDGKQRKHLSNAQYRAKANRLVKKIFRPQVLQRLAARGFATWYGTPPGWGHSDGFNGQPTSSGVRFDTFSHMCAMHGWMMAERNIHLGDRVIVENPYSGKKTVCRIMDHLGNPGAVIDLSYAVAKEIGRLGNGTVNIYAIP